LHEQYLACGVTERSDTLYMQSFHPDYRAELPRW
jgi:glucarate dehydratase